MKNRRACWTMFVMLLSASLAGGCADIVRAGATEGVTDGISALVLSVFNAILGSLGGGA